MPTIDVPCEDCLAKGWKQCPTCTNGTIPCPYPGCSQGSIPCPANCDNGWQRTGGCDYHSGLDPNCQACNAQGHMRCPRCNPFKLGGSMGYPEGRLPCPNGCSGGRLPCPDCSKQNRGPGKLSCETCGGMGTVAVWRDDPAPPPVETAYAPPPPPDSWAPQPPAYDPYEADRLRREQEDAQRERDRLADEDRLRREDADRRQREDDDRRRREEEDAAERQRLADEQRRREEEAAAEAERQRLAAIAAEEERRRNEGSA